MKKIALILCFLIICALAYSNELKELHIKATDSINNTYFHQINNYDIIIKEGNENYVKVIQRKGCRPEYPDVEIIGDAKENPIEKDWYYHAKYKGKYGCINREGKIIVPFKYEEEVGVFADNYVITESTKGLINQKGETIIPNEYSFVKIINDKYLLACKGNKFGIIDINNNVLIPFEYSFITYMDDDFICANKQIINPYRNYPYVKDKGYIIDIHNNIIKEFDNKVNVLCHEKELSLGVNEKDCSKDLLLVNGKIVDIKGNVIYDVRNYKCTSYAAGIVLESKSESVVLNHLGKEIYKGKNKKIWGCNKNAFQVSDQKNSLFGLIDKEGNVILNTEYEKWLRPIQRDEKNNRIITNNNYKYLAFIKDGKSVLVNLETLEKKEIDKEICEIDNEGKIYVKEFIKDRPNSWRVIPYYYF